MERKYTQVELRSIQAKQRSVVEDGLSILEKPIPGQDPSQGTLDPAVYAGMAPMFRGLKGFLFKRMMKSDAKKKKDPQRTALQMRRMMDGIKSIPIVTDVAEQRSCFRATEGHEVPLRFYQSAASGSALRPVFCYFHGGGFVAGRPEVVEELCKLMAQTTGCLAVQVEYRLAPEHPFPAGLDDCYQAVEWLFHNVASLGGDPKRICVSGDSAGGNLAAVCALRDRDEKKGMIRAQALLYPTVDAANTLPDKMDFDKIYTVEPSQENVIRPLLTMMSSMGSGNGIGDLLGVANAAIPYVSPIVADLSRLPPTLLLFGEFDFLRHENEAFARKLQRAGVKVEVIRYCGLSHAFADLVGVSPQAEDCIAEIGKFMLANA